MDVLPSSAVQFGHVLSSLRILHRNLTTLLPKNCHKGNNSDSDDESGKMLSCKTQSYAHATHILDVIACCLCN